MDSVRPDGVLPNEMLAGANPGSSHFVGAAGGIGSGLVQAGKLTVHQEGGSSQVIYGPDGQAIDPTKKDSSHKSKLNSQHTGVGSDRESAMQSGHSKRSKLNRGEG